MAKIYASLEFKCTSVRKVKKAFKYQKYADVLSSKSMRWLANAAKHNRYVFRHCHEIAEYFKDFNKTIAYNK